MLNSIELPPSKEIAVKFMQVATGLALLDEAATVPFIARYRKEATGGLDDVQLRLREERLCYLRELETRCQTIFESISALGKLTDGLKASILCSKDKNHTGEFIFALQTQTPHQRDDR